MPQAEADVVSQNLLVSISRKEISWCNKARLRGASTSRARAKVWAQLPGAGPRAWPQAWFGPQALGWGVPAPGPTGLGARAARLVPDPKLSHLRPVFRRSEKSPGKGLAKGWESAE